MTQTSIRTPAAFLFALGLCGCASAPQLRAPETPATALVLERAMAGTLEGEGVVTTLFGDKTHFAVNIAGNWDGSILTLVEEFRYHDGKTERKTWHLTRILPGQYRGEREDVIGTADVRQDGDAVRLDYQVLLDTPLGRIRTRFRDILFLRPNGSITNRATVSKLGLSLAHVDLSLRKPPIPGQP